MTRIWRRLHADRGADEGATLSELLVATVLFGLVGAIVATGVMVSLRTTRATQTRTSDLNAAQLAVDAMSKLLQTAAQPPAVTGGTAAPALITANPLDVQFYGYNNPNSPPAIIRFTAAHGTLTESITPSSNSGANACKPPYAYHSTTRTRVLATGVSTSSPVFTYYGSPSTTDYNGAVLTPSGSPANLSTANLLLVDSVAINLNVNQSSNPVVATTAAVTTVSLPNHLVPTPKLPSSAC